MRPLGSLASAATIVLLSGTAAFAAELPKACTGGKAPEAAPMGNMDMSAPNASMMMSMQKMNAGMTAAMALKDPDLAFLCGMIPHHQGAIDMARDVLKTGKDAEAKAMATAVITAQTTEIAAMMAMIERLGKM